MAIVEVVDLRISTYEFHRGWRWVFRSPDRVLNEMFLNQWASDRVIEAKEVLLRCELRADFRWDCSAYPYTAAYRLVLAAHFKDDRDAVAFKLAWEPETTLPWI